MGFVVVVFYVSYDLCFSFFFLLGGGGGVGFQI